MQVEVIIAAALGTLCELPEFKLLIFEALKFKNWKCLMWRFLQDENYYKSFAPRARRRWSLNVCQKAQNNRKISARESITQYAGAIMQRVTLSGVLPTFFYLLLAFFSLSLSNFNFHIIQPEHALCVLHPKGNFLLTLEQQKKGKVLEKQIMQTFTYISLSSR